jgi:hypothetical protein
VNVRSDVAGASGNGRGWKVIQSEKAQSALLCAFSVLVPLIRRNHRERLSLVGLGRRDSNPDKQIQSLRSYRWTTSQDNGKIVTERLTGMLLLGMLLQTGSRFAAFPSFDRPFNYQIGKHGRVH